MSEKLLISIETLEIAEEALRFYWRILLGHMDDLEALYRTGTIIPRTIPDSKRLRDAAGALKKELFGMGEGEAFALRDPRSPETARKAYTAMIRIQELQAGGGGEKAPPRTPAVPPTDNSASISADEVTRRIGFLRNHYGLTITAMGQQLGVRRETVSDWLRGIRQPGSDMKDLIIRKFRLPALFFQAQYPHGKYPAGAPGRETPETGQGEAKAGTATKAPAASTKYRPRGGSKDKLWRALRIIGIDFAGNDLALARKALAEASSMVGTSLDRAIFDEYCLQGKSGKEVGKKHGRKPYQLSVDLYRQAARIRKNRQAMTILRATITRSGKPPATVSGVLLGLGCEQDEAVRLTESLSAFNIKTVDDLRQAISEGDLEAIPGIGRDRAKIIAERLPA